MSIHQAGCVHFNTGNTVACDIKVLILLYTPEKKAFLGFVPNNQTGFVDRLRKVIQQKQSGVAGRQPGAVGPSGGHQQQQQQMPAQQQQHMAGQQQQQQQQIQQQQAQMVGGGMAGGGMGGGGMSGGSMAVVGNMAGGGNMAVGMGGNMPGQMQGNMAGGMQGGMGGNMGGMGNAMQNNMAMNQSNVQNQGVPNLSAVPSGNQVSLERHLYLLCDLLIIICPPCIDGRLRSNASSANAATAGQQWYANVHAYAATATAATGQHAKRATATAAAAESATNAQRSTYDATSYAKQ